MLKKTTIYSIMALSLTLLPSPEVMADISTDTTISSGTTTVNSINKWVGGKITNSGGTLKIEGDNVNPAVWSAGNEPNYTQSAGTLWLTSESDGSTVSFAQLRLIGQDADGKRAIISGGNVVIDESTTGDGNTLRIEEGANILGAVKVSLGERSNIVLRGNNGSHSGNNASLILDNADEWNGNIMTNYTAGQLTLSGYTISKGTDATYKQIAGTLALLAGSNFSLDNTGDYITSGTVQLGSAGETGNTLKVSARTDETIDGQTIGRGTTVEIYGGNTLSLDGTGTAILDSGDNWSGAITVADNTVLTLSGRNDVTTATKTYNQTGGTLNLGDTSGASSLTLGTTASKITGGTSSVVNITNGSTLTFKNNDDNGNIVNIAIIKMKDSNDNTLNIQNNGQGGSILNLTGVDTNISEITKGKVNIGAASGDNGSSVLTVGSGAMIGSDAVVNIYKGDETLNSIAITGNAGTGSSGEAIPSVVLSTNGSYADIWGGVVSMSDTDAILQLSAFNNSTDDSPSKDAILWQDAGTLNISANSSSVASNFQINSDLSRITGGTVNIDGGNTLHITTDTIGYINPDKSITPLEALLGDKAIVTINTNANLKLTGTGTAILNDNMISVSGSDTWDGDVTVGSSDDTPVLTLKNVTKDFTKETDPLDQTSTGTLTMNSGTVNVYANENGGSHITVYDNPELNPRFTYNGGSVNIQGNDANTLSTFTTVVTKDGEITNSVPLNLQGNAQIEYKLNGHNATISSVVPTGSGPNNTMVQSGNGTLNLNAPGADLNMGYNLRVEDGTTYVNANSMTIGTYNAGSPYGYLQIGMPGNTTETNFYTNALTNRIIGDMSLNNAWYHTTNPNSVTSVGGNLHTGSGIDMMYGKINSINVAGTHTIDNLKLKIDVDPATYRADTINSAAVIANPNSTLDLVDYNLLSEPRRDRYTFRVVNAANENYAIGAGAKKIVSQNKVTWTKLGGYQMIPSAVKGAFDMVITQFNPQIFRGQVAANVIYANQLAITNQLFDRMIYSNLPYFNDDCTNKTAAANTLFSPYQYSTNDTGLWFKPYANFETIRMSYVGNVRNNAYGAMIGADFAKKKWGEWSFIPTAFIGYNGGHSTYRAVGMWHNGGQGGLMGTLTRKNFVTSMAVYAGGYHNVMNVGGYTDRNALWNVGVASKTAYNIPLFWDLILQPTLYMAYNYVGGSDFDSNYEGYMHKIHGLNAYSVAPGLNLIWQKETFSIYALFQAMFNINAVSSGQIAEVNLPHIGIRDPYFEYGLGFSKFFKDRFSGYGQAVARSGSRKGVGFQLGLNMKL